MKAIRIHQYGSVDELKFEEIPNPMANDEQVLVRLAASSVNLVDHKLASGELKHIFPLRFPWTPGADFSGTIEAVGRGVSEFKKGDEVFGWNPGFGAYAQMLVVPQSLLVRKPKNLTHVQAASLATVAQAAWIALFEIGKIKAGQRVLTHGGAGGVGTIAVQLAHNAGAKVYTTASAGNKEHLLSLGADEVIDYQKVPFESVAKSMDLVIDTIGGDTQQRSFQTLKPGGLLISTVQPPSPEEAQKFGVTAMMMRTEGNPKRLEKIAELAAKGELKTIVSKVYPLADVKEAWRHVLSRHAKGKIALNIDG
jgi:NADPH:quinone reductase-like Zn-dependent oxidoreductase